MSVSLFLCHKICSFSILLLDSMYQWYHMMLSLSVWLTSLSIGLTKKFIWNFGTYRTEMNFLASPMIISGSTHVAQMALFHSFDDWVILHQTHVTSSLSSSPVDGHLGCLPVLATAVNGAAVNIYLFIIVLSGCMLSSGSAGSSGTELGIWNRYIVWRFERVNQLLFHMLIGDLSNPFLISKK